MNSTVIEVNSERAKQALDVTELVANHLPTDGVAMVSVPHTTCALVFSEDDPDLLADIEHVAAGLLAGFEPFTHARHDVPNAAAHIMSSMFGTSLLVRTAGGRLQLGEWQRVVFVELDGPRVRRIEITPLNDVATLASAT